MPDLSSITDKLCKLSAIIQCLPSSCRYLSESLSDDTAIQHKETLNYSYILLKCKQESSAKNMITINSAIFFLFHVILTISRQKKKHGSRVAYFPLPHNLQSLVQVLLKTAQFLDSHAVQSLPHPLPAPPWTQEFRNTNSSISTEI